MKQYVVGIGEVLWDMLPNGRKIGGAPANFAYHVSQFGLDGCVVSAVGDDALGDEIVNGLTSKGQNFKIARVPYETGTVLVEMDDAGVPQYVIKENVAWDNIPFTPELEELAKNTKAVCFGSLAQRGPVSRDTINRFLNAMPKDDDRLVVFDINLRQRFYTRQVIDNSIAKCNVLKINDEELDIVSRVFGFTEIDPKDKCRRLMENYNLKMLILTCGANGSYVFTPEIVSFLPTPSVKVKDTVGAGDSFTAAFVSSILEGSTVREAHSRAVQTSAFVCTQSGATPALPDAIKGF